MGKVTAIVLIVAVFVCLTPTRSSAGGGADFSTYVALGDGFTAGFQDGALHADGQRLSYAALIATAAGQSESLPLLTAPGLPHPNPVTGLGLLVQRPGTCAYGEFDLASGRSTGRVDPALAARNVAVPYQRIGDAETVEWRIDPNNPNEPDAFEDFILGFPASLTPGATPRTQLETAVALDPTFVSVWLGSMDALLPAIAGTASDDTLTQPNDFARSVDSVFNALAATGANGVVVNVPNVTSSAFLLSAKDLKDRTRYSTKQLKNRLGVLKTSYVVLSAIPTVDAIKQGQASGPLSDNQILTKQELAKIQDAITRYNKALKEKANALGWAYVDLNEIFDRYEKRGVTIDGVGTLTTKYLGGLYSLDGIHPSRTGQALIASAVLSAVNQKYGTSLPLPNVNAIASADPLVCALR